MVVPTIQSKTDLSNKKGHLPIEKAAESPRSAALIAKIPVFVDRLESTWKHVDAIIYPSTPSIETTRKAKEAFHIIALKKTYVPEWVKAITVLCPFIRSIILMIEKVLITRHTDQLTKKFHQLLDSINKSSFELAYERGEHKAGRKELTPEKSMKLLVQLSTDIDKFTKAFDALKIPKDNDNEHFKELSTLRKELSELSTMIGPQLIEIINNDRSSVK